jgi:SNF2 family DNA or RNA helicase
MIISPESSNTATIARVWTSGNGLFCSFREHNETFRKQVKSVSLEWSEAKRAWQRVLNEETSGQPQDRAAELASKLVNAGFTCEVDEPVAELVRMGLWEPEQKRWVKFIEGKYQLRWRGQDENLYHRALMLPEAQYDSNTKSVAIPAIYFSEVIGFSEEHEFQFTKVAQESLENSRREYQRVILPEAPTPKKKTKKIKEHFCKTDKFNDLPARNIQTKTDLLAHQIPAVEKIMPRRVGALFMDMGTGKTRCAIELVARRQQRTSRVIWFCPVSLKLTIATEIEKHTSGESVHIFNGETGQGDLPNVFWYIVGIESMSSSDRVVLAVHELIDQDAFVIVDESSYIKGHASKRSMRIGELSSMARYRLLLTGTPITQGVVDLYAQMRFLSPDILGYNSFYSFANNHLEYSEKYPGMIVRGLHVGQLTDKLTPFIYQVTKDECMDLPEKLYDQVYFGLSDEQHVAYQEAKEEILNGIMEEIPDYIIFQLFTALQQIVSGFWNRNGKEFIRLLHKRIDTLQTVIAGIPENEKVIIWSKYVESVQQIAKTLPDCALYYGGLSEKKRDEQLQLFRGSARFLVATQASGGHGLTLNEAHYHIFYENEFKYSHRVQAEDRSHRIGQTKHVTYIDIVSNSGIDRRIQNAIAKKEDVVKAFRNEINKRKGMDL